MNEQSLKLIPLPDAQPSASGHRYVMAHLENEAASLFEPHWDKPVPDGLLAGLTVEEAMAKLTEERLGEIYGIH